MSAPPPNPCRGCTKRHAHCHGECGPYLAFYEWRRQENERSLRSQDADQMKISGIMKAKRLARLMKGKKT
jgi:hypothetical protein